MPFSPYASPRPHPSTSALVVAELGLAPFWKMTVFSQGESGQPPCLALVRPGAGLTSRSLLLPCRFLQSVQDKKRRSEGELEEQEWPLLKRTSTPVTVYLKQKKIRRLVLGELCSPSERREEQDLDFLPPQ